jgi:trk system potassium uptake protein
MNLRAVFFVLGNLLIILGVSLCAPAVVGLAFSTKMATHPSEAMVFFSTAAISVCIGGLVRYWCRDAAEDVRLREGFAVVGLSWVMASFVGMLPYLLLGATTSVTDAFFETMSGFTTTGASVFSSYAQIPPALMFWRCMTQWLGGMGIVVLSIALLPMLGVGGYRLLKAEAPGGVTYERERPRMSDTAKQLWRIYIVMSALLLTFLMLSGMSFYDAICHAFTTMSTGGFSNREASIAYYQSPLIQWVLIFFMLLAGVNFSLYANILRLNWLALFRNTELRCYLLTIVAASLIGVSLLSSEGLGEKEIRDCLFQILSIITTTGYASVDYDTWPHGLRLMLLALMFCGGCMGSTAGGMKMARMAIYAKAFVREMKRLIFPHSVQSLRLSKRVVSDVMINNIFAFGFIFMGAFFIGAMVMALSGYDIETSLSASVAALGNIGPGLGKVGPTATWAHLPAAAKWVMSFLMLCGRLEMFSFLILLSPWLWRR